jgi:hypothetical protein
MRDEQGWTIVVDPERIRDNLDRAAKFSCYALVNRLVFYEALMKRYGAQLSKASVPEHIEKGDDLRLHLEAYFADAKKVTGDYETVFGEDHTNIGSRVPFYSDQSTRYWRSLISEIHKFDFSKLDYEVIGSIFERLISPEERHKHGQYYSSGSERTTGRWASATPDSPGEERGTQSLPAATIHTAFLVW